MYSRVTAMLSFISRSNYALFASNPLGNAPDVSDFNPIDAISPGIRVCKCRLVDSISELEFIELTAGKSSHLNQRRLNFGQYVARYYACEVRKKDIVIGVLIAEHWRKHAGDYGTQCVEQQRRLRIADCGFRIDFVEVFFSRRSHPSENFSLLRVVIIFGDEASVLHVLELS
jgi:hypothetical protein